MKITKFEQVEAWQLARDLTQKIYQLTAKASFSKDFRLRSQIQGAAGSSMHNIAEGFDSDTTAEFIRFLRYAKRSCTETQSELYIALDQKYISASGFQEAYNCAGRTRAAIHGFIKYLLAYAKDNKRYVKEPDGDWQVLTLNPEPL